MYEELKRKMGEFAEPDLPYYYSKILVGEDGSFIKEEKQIGYWVKDGMAYRELPDFTESLDACFEWLVPKLSIEGYGVEIKNYSDGKFGARVTLTKSVWESEDAEAETPALALCLAIEKLIDKEIKKDG